MVKSNLTLIQLPGEKPDCCAECPLCGVIPKNQRPKGSMEGFVCLGTHEALGSRFINVRASQKDSKHPLHRPCDNRWHAWMMIPGRRLSVNSRDFMMYRFPFEQSRQMVIKFHNVGPKKGRYEE